jgi:acyl transferase domain-containing protein
LDSQSPAGLQSESRAESELRSEPEPGYQVQAREEQQPQLLLFSGKSEIAATMLNDRVLARIVTDASLPPAAATTLAHHRRHFKHRRFQVVDPNGVPTDQPAGSGEARTGRALAFLFPGQGAQYPRMGQSLYRDHPAFRSTLDRCAEVLVPELGCDLRDLLFRPTDEADDRLNQTRYTQPLLFVLAVSLSDLWRSRGVRPDALVGHSIGEYAAASIAGVMTLDDALRLVAARGRMMHALPSGAMLSVSLAADELAPVLETGSRLPAVNGPRSCVASGAHGAIAALRQLMMDRGIQCGLLRTSHAFHSSMMDPVLTAFEAEVAKVRLDAPQVPIMSTVTARWLTDEEATSPRYWSRQLRLPVRFADAVEALWKHKDYVALELGPRATATTLARRMSTDRSAQVAVPSLSNEPGLEQAALLGATGQLWAMGLAVDLRAVAPEGPPVDLPGYPFKRERHWIEPAAHERRDLAGIKALLQAQGAVLREQAALLEQRVAAHDRATASAAE